MSDLTDQLPPEIDFSSFDFTNLTNSFLPGAATLQSIGEKYLIFFLDEEIYAVASRQVVEVAPPLHAALLPNIPEWLVGVANLRNELISVVSLRSLLKKQILASPQKSKMIVLRAPNSASNIAFTVDKLGEIISLRCEEIEFNTDEKSPYIFGKAVHQSDKLTLINTENLLSSLII